MVDIIVFLLCIINFNYTLYLVKAGYNFAMKRKILILHTTQKSLCKRGTVSHFNNRPLLRRTRGAMFRFFLFLTLTIMIEAREIKPAFVMQTSGLVSDFVIDADKLYVGTDAGVVDIFSLRSRELINQIFIKPNITALGVEEAAKIISVDRYKGETLIVSMGSDGYRYVWLHDGEHLRAIITPKDKQVIRKARFIDNKHFLFASVGYEMSKYTLNDNYTIYKKHIEQSTFSDMELSEDKKRMVSVSESGQVAISDVASGAVLQTHALNLDNIYKVAYQNGTIITAGQDRRVAVYPKEGKPYVIKSDFLVYAVGLSPSGKIGVYSSNEESDLQLFDVRSGEKRDRLIGHKALPSTIRFFSEKGFFSAGYENKIFYWHLEE
jgi:WD40 repeat protein